mmetsp:Transcript_5212/g.32738  ORF Transcript_5212/g.32738 Transcript_5212/m.32738 type:complete len:216 (-) Transcript_5212:3256-3903(-)
MPLHRLQPKRGSGCTRVRRRGGRRTTAATHHTSAHLLVSIGEAGEGEVHVDETKADWTTPLLPTSKWERTWTQRRSDLSIVVRTSCVPERCRGDKQVDGRGSETGTSTSAALENILRLQSTEQAVARIVRNLGSYVQRKQPRLRNKEGRLWNWRRITMPSTSSRNCTIGGKRKDCSHREEWALHRRNRSSCACHRPMSPESCTWDMPCSSRCKTS